jgi:hypothetical protein
MNTNPTLVTTMMWICQSSCTKCMFHFLYEVVAKLKVSIYNTLTVQSYHMKPLQLTIMVEIIVVLRATLHLEAGPIRCVRGLKSSFVIGQKVQISFNPFTLRGRADLVVWIFLIKIFMLWHDPSSLNWVHQKWRANSWPRGHCHISLKKNLLK